MDISEIVEGLKTERERLDKAITALESVNGNGRTHTRLGRPPGPRRRHMSAAARKRISAAMRARWAARKSHTNGGKTAAPRVGTKLRSAWTPAQRAAASKRMKDRWKKGAFKGKVGRHVAA